MACQGPSQYFVSCIADLSQANACWTSNNRRHPKAAEAFAIDAVACVILQPERIKGRTTNEWLLDPALRHTRIASVSISFSTEVCIELA